MGGDDAPTTQSEQGEQWQVRFGLVYIVHWMNICTGRGPSEVLELNEWEVLLTICPEWSFTREERCVEHAIT